uniref:NR LBD domain-containing protein n=1 Tax=Caenorhabditis tropicalis TaxID=1561998 RepID=A0A1I7TU67_9PELO
MDKTSTSGSEMTPEQSVRECLRLNPIKMSPFDIHMFFADDKNVSEEYLDRSIDSLAEFDSNFEETHKELFVELQKWALMLVPLVRKIPLFKLLGIIQECASSTQVFPFIPDFPKPPATKLLDHIFPDNSLSSEEKILEYEQIAKNTNVLLGHLCSWRDNVVEYVEGLEKFLKYNKAQLSDEQIERINQLLQKSKRTIPQIDLKIEQKQHENAEEIQEFEKFYKVVSKEQKVF